MPSLVSQTNVKIAVNLLKVHHSADWSCFYVPLTHSRLFSNRSQELNALFGHIFCKIHIHPQGRKFLGHQSNPTLLIFNSFLGVETAEISLTTLLFPLLPPVRFSPESNRHAQLNALLSCFFFFYWFFFCWILVTGKYNLKLFITTYNTDKQPQGDWLSQLCYPKILQSGVCVCTITCDSLYRPLMGHLDWALPSVAELRWGL